MSGKDNNGTTELTSVSDCLESVHLSGSSSVSDQQANLEAEFHKLYYIEQRKSFLKETDSLYQSESYQTRFKKWFPKYTAKTSGGNNNKMKNSDSLSSVDFHKDSNPKLRIICFPNAGSAELIYTGAKISYQTDPKSGSRKRESAPNMLMSFAEENDVEILAVQLPGRELRIKEDCLTSCATIAREVLALLAPLQFGIEEIEVRKFYQWLDGEKVDREFMEAEVCQTNKENDDPSENIIRSADNDKIGKNQNDRQRQVVPYAIIGHSCGNWQAYEFLRLLDSFQKYFLKGKNSETNATSSVANKNYLEGSFPVYPLHFFSSCMLPPTVCDPRASNLNIGFSTSNSIGTTPSYSFRSLPWEPNATLSKSDFQEECRCWQINESVFQPLVWNNFEKMLRGDFTLFDTYVHNHDIKAILQQSQSGKTTSSTLQGNNQSIEREKESVKSGTENHLDLGLEYAFRFPFPISAFYAHDDSRISKAMVEGWSAFTSRDFSIEEIFGSHLFIYDHPTREDWFEAIIDTIIGEGYV